MSNFAWCSIFSVDPQQFWTLNRTKIQRKKRQSGERSILAEDYGPFYITLAFAFITTNIYQSDVHKDRKKVFSSYTITEHIFQSMSFNLYTKVGNSEKTIDLTGVKLDCMYVLCQNWPKWLEIKGFHKCLVVWNTHLM